ncbi:MAG: Flp pilus assembly complex ATPase component TadA [Lentisphaeria bacterium]|nr:Flp pilus assembly complex ATPase component TadA [Lentisphaeria bacterium]
MQLDVQWFIYALVQNQIVSAEQAVELNDEFGGDPTLEEYAEEIQRQLSAEFDVAGAANLAKQIRMVVRYAISQASTGTSPEIFEEIEEVIEPETPVQPLPLPITPPPMAPRPLSQVPAQEVVEIVEEEEVYEEIIEEVVEEDAVTGDDSDEIAYADDPQIELETAPDPEPEPAPQEEELAPPPPGSKEDRKEDLSGEDASKVPPLLTIPGLQDRYLEPFEKLISLSETGYRDVMIKLLLELRDCGASDLYVSSDQPLMVRFNRNFGRLMRKKINSIEAMKLNMAVLNLTRRSKFEQEHEINCVLDFTRNRVRASIFKTRTGVCGAFHFVPEDPLPLDKLGILPEDAGALQDLLAKKNGLFIVAGVAGSGKNTMLLSLLDQLNRKEPIRIVTLENPLENVIPCKEALVSQRELGRHIQPGATALDHLLKEDPNAIFIGDLNEDSILDEALIAAGNLRIAGALTASVDTAGIIRYLVDAMPQEQRQTALAVTAERLRGILCLRQLPGIGNKPEVIYELFMAPEGWQKQWEEKGTLPLVRSFTQCIREKLRQRRITADSVRDHFFDISRSASDQ